MSQRADECPACDQWRVRDGRCSNCGYEAPEPRPLDLSPTGLPGELAGDGPSCPEGSTEAPNLVSKEDRPVGDRPDGMLKAREILRRTRAWSDAHGMDPL